MSCLQLKSAVMAVERDTAVVIANGLKQGETILDIVKGKLVGTLITRNGHMEIATSTEHMANDGRWPWCTHELQQFIFTSSSLTRASSSSSSLSSSPSSSSPPPPPLVSSEGWKCSPVVTIIRTASKSA